MENLGVPEAGYPEGGGTGGEVDENLFLGKENGPVFEGIC